MSDYNWIAQYGDGTTLCRFMNGEEKLFKDINHDELVLFNVSIGVKQVMVDLTFGTISINGNTLVFSNSNREENYRLIYFRRVRHDFNTKGAQSVNVKHFIGYQITVDDKNHKVIIDTDGHTYEIIQK